jgi:uncharacterized membrane protein YfcA
MCDALASLIVLDQVFAILVAIAFLAGAVDAIAGGGSLLTLPALMLMGFDPLSAIATNRLQSAFGTATAAISFMRAGRVDFRSAPLVSLAALAGAAAGALSAAWAPVALLKAVLPVTLILVAIYVLISPQIRDVDAPSRLASSLLIWLIHSLIGFYAGIFGPATGTFFTLASVICLGHGIVRANANAKVANVATDISALTVFMISGAIIWSLGLAMAASQMLGAVVGSRAAIYFGIRLIRPVLVAVSCGMAARLLADPANPIYSVFDALLRYGR